LELGAALVLVGSCAVASLSEDIYPWQSLWSRIVSNLIHLHREATIGFIFAVSAVMKDAILVVDAFTIKRFLTHSKPSHQ
jgi:hypothetical protein